MSSIEVLKKTLPSKKKDLLFILNSNSCDSFTRGIWDRLKAGEKSLSLELERVDLYNALRYFMRDAKLITGPYGDVREDYILKLEDSRSIKETADFMRTILSYSQLESPNRTRSSVEDLGLSDFKKRMNSWAQSYTSS